MTIQVPVHRNPSLMLALEAFPDFARHSNSSFIYLKTLYIFGMYVHACSVMLDSLQPHGL